MMETGETFPKKGGRTKSVGPVLQAYLPQSSRALLLVNVNEVADHSSLKGAVLCLHPYLDMILKTNMRRQLACLFFYFIGVELTYNEGFLINYIFKDFIYIYISFIDLLFFFYGRTHSIWKFLGHGLNPQCWILEPTALG